MKALLVGTDPGGDMPMAGGAPAFVGSSSGENLAKLAGLRDSHDLLDYFDLDNLYRFPVARWSKRDAELEMRDLLAREVEADRRFIILCGTECRDAGSLELEPAFTWLKRWAPFLNVAWMYHPSGLCRKWNHPSTYGAGRAFLRGTIELTRENVA